jgi:hypothetical protein
LIDRVIVMSVLDNQFAKPLANFVLKDDAIRRHASLPHGSGRLALIDRKS